MHEPIAHVTRQALRLQLRMQSVRSDERLVAQVGPRFLQAIARGAKFAAARIRFQHLQTPAQARGEP